MHSSESLDPVVNRLLENLPYLENWLADMSDALNLVDLLVLHLKDPGLIGSDRLVSLLRMAVTSLTSGVDEYRSILSLAEKVTPVMTHPDTTDTHPDTGDDTHPDTHPDTGMTPVTLDQFVAALFPVNGKN
jgi:hypothetical protein